MAVDVHAAHCEPRVGGRGNHRHQVAVLTRGHPRLHPGLTRGHKDHFVEVEVLLHLTRGHQVTVVNRVEGSAHDPNAGATGLAIGHGIRL